MEIIDRAFFVKTQSFAILLGSAMQVKLKRG